MGVDLGVSRNPEPPTAKDGKSISISRMREPRDQPVEGLRAARRYKSKPVVANRACDSRIAHDDARFGDRPGSIRTIHGAFSGGIIGDAS